MAQPGHFVTPPCIIKTVSAGDVGPGTQHLALWPRGTRTALAKQGCSTAQRRASRGSRVRAGMGMGWLLPRLLSQPGTSLGGDIGVALAVLPSQRGSRGTARLRSAGSRSAGPKGQRVPPALPCVLRLGHAMTDFGAESCCFGERSLSEHRGLQSVIGGCVITVPRCGVRGAVCAPAAGAEGV